jgi:hypothetical protein
VTQLAPNVRGQATGRTVLILKFNNHANGPKYFFLHNLHLRPGVCEDGRLDEETLRTMPHAAKMEGGAIPLAGFDVRHDTLGVDNETKAGAIE